LSESPSAGAAITVEGLVKRYGDRTVLDGVSFAVPRGSLVALLGPNGAGKTTTVEILEGYRRADGGRVRVLGLDPARDGRALRPKVGLMLQSGGLAPLATVGELVSLFARYFANPVEPAALIAQVGLDDVAGSRVRTLSGGERQRLSLALALVGRPELLVLDEPTAGMDPEAKRATRELIAGLRGGGATILLTTHELADVERLADRVLVLDRGRIVADAAPGELGAGGPSVVRFRLAAGGAPPALPDLDGTRIVAEASGWYRLDGAAGSPDVVAALAAACAARGLAIVELRVGGGTLEERYLELVGGRSVA
jgi:ABC-2 type transport system ATP-binding protein